MAIAGKVIVPCISPNLTFQSGDGAFISGICGEGESVIEIRRLLSVRVGEAYTVVVESDLYRQVGMHQANGCITVLPNRSRVHILAEKLLRKAILMPVVGQRLAGKYFLLLDFMRPFPVTDSTAVVVPVYVVVNDMVLIMGDQNELWYGRVVGNDHTDRNKPVRVNFYAESRCPKHYKRESNRIDEVHMNSVVGVAQERWSDNYKQWIADN